MHSNLATYAQNDSRIAKFLDADDNYVGPEYVYILNPGTQPTNLHKMWFEMWGSRTATASDILCRATHASGAYQSNAVKFEGSAMPDKVICEAAGRDDDNQGGQLRLEVENDFGGRYGNWEAVGEGSSIIIRDPDNIRMSRLPVETRGFHFDGVQHISDSSRGGYERGPVRQTKNLYTYTGGTPFNEQCRQESSIWSEYYPHNHPTMGACLLIRRGSKQNAHLRLEAQLDVGDVWHEADQVHGNMFFTLPHPSTGAGTQTTVEDYVEGNGIRWVETPIGGFSGSGLARVVDGWIRGKGCKIVGDRKNLIDDPSQLMAPQPTYNEDPKWALVAGWTIGLNKYVPIQQNLRADCFESPLDPGLPDGTYVEGDVVRKLQPDTFDRWVCTGRGTSRTINETCDVSGSTLSNVSDITELIEGDFIEVGGDGTQRRVISIDEQGGTVTLDSAPEDGAGLSIANDPPTHKQATIS
jgi:hypothetical protein